VPSSLPGGEVILNRTPGTVSRDLRMPKLNSDASPVATPRSTASPIDYGPTTDLEE
jgi:hypothetical protein